jgi:hypothetical protein
MDTVVISAFYPVKTGKHSKLEYAEWVCNFFECVTCPVIIFCDLEFPHIKRPNIRYISRPFDSFKLIQEPWKTRWEEWHKIDHEKDIHSPDLYAIWAAKQEFVQEAMKVSDYSIYVWCDIGCFRTVRNGSFKYTSNYTEPSKITCLSICNMIGGGVLAGDRDAWNIFTTNFLRELERDINGKDQVIYKRILNTSNAVIINPTYQYGDPWFYLTYIFSF